MSRDIDDRMDMFNMPMEVNRIALNMDQVRAYNPPPNPAKTTDSRYQGYIVRFGDESWELDALEPRTLINLVQETIEQYIDPDDWDQAEAEEQAGIDMLGDFQQQAAEQLDEEE